MKIPFFPALGPLLFLAVNAVFAADPAPSPAAPAPVRELALVVIEPIGSHGGAITAFDRLDIAFTDVVKQRKWPVKLVAERFAANTPDHETELRVFYKELREDVPGERTIRAWMTLTDRGQKHDFGMVVFRYSPRLGEPFDQMIEKMFLGLANAGADKISPLLFPKT